MDGSQICTPLKKRGVLYIKQGRPAKGALQSYPDELRKQIRDLRTQNEGWGAISILVELEHAYSYSKNDLPCPASVHRYLKECSFIKAKIPKGHLGDNQLPTAYNFHDLWEMDAQGAVQVTGIGYVSMINIKDAKSKVYVASFPVQVKSRKSQPKTEHYLWTLRLAFEEFGLPKAIQVDKDSVFIDSTSKSPFPSIMHLFLLGLGIELCFIDKAPPVKQAMVERAHQTLEKQVLKGKSYKTWQELFANTNQRRKVLNQKYPCRTLNKQAPLQAFPKAAHSGRKYTVEQEKQLLRKQRIKKYLETCKWFRKVSSSKTISLKRIYYLKNAESGTYVQINFCAKSNKLIFRDVNERVIQKELVKDLVEKRLNQPSTNELIVKRKQLYQGKDFPLK